VGERPLTIGRWEGKKNYISAKPGMGERGGLLGLFLSFILFFSIPASWRANEMGVPALPCPFPLFPLISSCFGFCCKKKVKTQRIHIKCVKARSLSACIASLKTDTNLFDGSNVGCFFFFFPWVGAQKLPGGNRASFASSPSSSCLSPPLLYPYAPFWCRYRPKAFLRFDPAGTAFEAPGTG
jgi:hypothetical protein